MLSKGAKNCGMRDKRWTIRDKITQYRGILKLHGREKKLRAIDAGRARKRTSRELKILSGEVKEYRGILNEVENGDKRRIHTMLQGHKDFQLAYENHNPGTVSDAVDQDNCLKRRQLDKLYYVKRKRMKESFDHKLELTHLKDEYELQSLVPEPDRDQQSLIALYHEARANETAAKAVNRTYQSMLNILEKETFCFDAVLKALKGDRVEQCTVLLRTTTMGQLAAEDLDDTHQRYKRMANDVWRNMKERERNLKRARTKVKNLWQHARSLVRVESDMDYAEKLKGRKKSVADEDLKKQIEELEATFERVKDALMIRSSDEMFTRFEEQKRKKERLIGQFNRNLEERDLYLNKKEHASVILANLEHSMITTTGQYKANKKETLEQIEYQKRRKADCEKKRRAKGEVLINVRSALLNMLGLLEVVKRGKGSGGGGKKATKDHDKKTREKARRNDEKESEDERSMRSFKPDTQRVETVDTDALSLLSQVTKKMMVLYGMSNFDLDEESERNARTLYQTYVANAHSKMRFGDEDVEPTGIVVEHQVIDTSVFTREDIKNRSQQIVEANTRYQ
ncbi:uncharacterized protein LOC107048473 [Diachasma alloeum]|uniref:uncharacterized protein LOC107048473 n=1 Tax=Diachasma alloeum TaxID=454923 RepID=UPI000738438F|nr:uncharacterized protein LOC107048473 [Diachasma alloeum]